MKWEHTMRAFDAETGLPSMEKSLNELGGEGWELVNVQRHPIADHPFYLCILKRAIPE